MNRLPFTLIRQDITKLRVDAIVNAANTSLQMGGGVCGAIFEVAGKEELQAACDTLAPIQKGEAVMTPGFRLPAKSVIHTAGPIYQDGKSGEEALLRKCYLNSLKLAAKKQCESIAFPLISSGIYGYPPAEAFRVAAATIREFLQEHDISVFLSLLHKSLPVIDEETLDKVDQFIEAHYDRKRYGEPKESDNRNLYQRLETFAAQDLFKQVISADEEVGSLVINLDESFSHKLLRLIDEKGKTDVEVYKRANIDRKLFSKIRTDKDYTPRKRTAIALAVALELSLQETGDLLMRAGYTLSRSHVFDIIVEYFIKNKTYDVFEINETLFRHDQPLLGE